VAGLGRTISDSNLHGTLWHLCNNSTLCLEGSCHCVLFLPVPWPSPCHITFSVTLGRGQQAWRVSLSSSGKHLCLFSHLENSSSPLMIRWEKNISIGTSKWLKRRRKRKKKDYLVGENTTLVFRCSRHGRLRRKETYCRPHTMQLVDVNMTGSNGGTALVLGSEPGMHCCRCDRYQPT